MSIERVAAALNARLPGRVEREVGDGDSALAAFNAYLDRGENRGHIRQWWLHANLHSSFQRRCGPLFE